jgi:predicted nucleic acid-binding Zn ribbon protein
VDNSTSAGLEKRDLAHDALADARAMASGRRDRTSRRSQRRRRRSTNDARGQNWSGAHADGRDPQRLSSIVRSVFDERGWQQPITEARVFTDWATLVGADIASHCQPTALTAGELKLAAQSSAWATQLRLLSPTLLARLSTQLGAGVVTRITVSGPAGPSWKHGYRTVPGARGPRDTYG